MTTKLTGSEAGEAPIRGLLIDLDGVVYVGSEPIPGAVEAIRGLRKRGLPLRFITNTSTKPARTIEEKLESLGVEVTPGDVMSPVRAAAATLVRMQAESPYLVVDERIVPEFAHLSPVGAFPDRPARPPDFIVVGDIGSRWDYELMSSLFAMISAGTRLLALHKGRSWQTESGLVLDIGAFVAGLEYATGREAIITGKPYADFFRAAVADMGIRCEEAVMIGDDIDGDVGGAQAAGLRGVLVKTGKYRREYAERSGVAPWRTLESLAEVDRLPGPAG